MRFLVPDDLDEVPLEGEVGEVGGDGMDPELLELERAVDAGLQALVDFVELRLLNAGPAPGDDFDLDLLEVSSDGEGGEAENDPGLPGDIEEPLVHPDSDGGVELDDLLGGPRVPLDVSSSGEEEE